MKTIVVGCTHAGTAAINQIKKTDPSMDITVYERNDNISFLSCGIALYVGGVVEDKNGLFYSSPEILKNMGVVTKMEHEIQAVDIKGKKMTVKNLQSGEVFEDTFDKLVITTGSWPIVPRFEGGDLDNILLSKNFNHANEIIARAEHAKRITVIGAGYIGVELVEAFEQQGKEVILIDAMDRIMSKYYDAPYTDQAEEAFKAHGVELALGQSVKKFEGKDGNVSKVITDKNEFETDMVILCIGFRPNTDLFKGQLEMLPNGAIKIDSYMRTSEENIYAAGDCCSVIYNPTGEFRYIPLATNAIRMGTLVGLNIHEQKVKYMGTQGTSGIKIYDLDIASSGVTEETAKDLGLNYKTVTIEENHRPEFMPTYHKAMLKLLYDADSRVVLGGQIIAKTDLTQMMNTLSVCIQNKMTVEELAFTDFFFQPHYNKPWGLLNQVALKAME